MRKHFFSKAVLSVAMIFGAIAALPGNAMASDTVTGHASQVATSSIEAVPTIHIVANTTSPFRLQNAFTALAARGENPGGNACDPITPKNWCACGGCSGSFASVTDAPSAGK